MTLCLDLSTGFQKRVRNPDENNDRGVWNGRRSSLGSGTTTRSDPSRISVIRNDTIEAEKTTTEPKTNTPIGQ